MDARQHFLSRFEPNGEDFTFRAMPEARGVLVTAEERARMVAIYGSRRRIAIAVSVLNLPITVFVARSVDRTPAISSWTAPVAWLMVLGVTISSFVWAFAGPRRIVRGRPYIDFGASPRALEQRRREALRETSWVKLFRRYFSLGLLGYLAFIRTPDAEFGRVEAVGVVLFACLAFVREAIDKYRDVRSAPLDEAP